MTRDNRNNRRRLWPLVIFVTFAAVVFVTSPGQANTFGTMYISTDTTLTENHDGDVVITSDNVTLDCGGRSIVGNLPVGIRLEDRTNVTVRNCQVSGFVRGFLILNSVRNVLLGNTANHNQFGFALAGASGNHLGGNTANNNEFAGFAPGLSIGNTFSGNTANLNGRNGFEIHLSSNANVFLENTANNNGAAGFGVANSLNNRFVANTANGNENGFGLSQSNDTVLEDNTAIRNSFAGFALGESSNNTLVGNRAKNNAVGMYFVSSSFNLVESNNGTPNVQIDAYQSGGAGNVFSDNKFTTTDGI
jgi:parallel beta-helix repeat protein